MRYASQLGLVSCLVMCSVMPACIAGDAPGEQADDEAAIPGDEATSVEESAVTTPQFRGEYNFRYTGFPFGIDINVPLGGACSPFRRRASYTVERTEGAGSCDANGWISSLDADCTAKIRIRASWTQSGNCRVRVFEHPANVVLFKDDQFRGDSKRFDPGHYDVNDLGIGNDQLSSLQVPPGWVATLYWDAGFVAIKPPLVVTADMPYVGNAFNDQASSMIVTRAPGSPN